MDAMLKEPPLNYIEFFKIFGPTIATSTIAVVATIIAVRQYLVARNTLKLALFTKRIELYETITKIIDGLIADPSTHTIEARFGYLNAISSSGWLFDNKIKTHLKEKMWEAMAACVRSYKQYREADDFGSSQDAAIALDAFRRDQMEVQLMRASFVELVDKHMKLSV